MVSDILRQDSRYPRSLIRVKRKDSRAGWQEFIRRTHGTDGYHRRRRRCRRRRRRRRRRHCPTRPPAEPVQESGPRALGLQNIIKCTSTVMHCMYCHALCMYVVLGPCAASKESGLPAASSPPPLPPPSS